MNRINYDEKLSEIIRGLDHRPVLLMHSCCAPCSSYCLIYLMPYFDITCYYYNPNITDDGEYEKRARELERLADMLNDEFDPVRQGHAPVTVITGRYDPDSFIEEVRSRGLEDCPERGSRCGMCFDMRLRETYREAERAGAEYFTTTLTISPQKDAQLINSIGYGISEGGERTKWLPSDFKKRDGYRKSVELSGKYGLYRQNYCGCVYSLR